VLREDQPQSKDRYFSTNQYPFDAFHHKKYRENLDAIPPRYEFDSPCAAPRKKLRETRSQQQMNQVSNRSSIRTFDND
jgi:hypothetical protein